MFSEVAAPMFWCSDSRKIKSRNIEETPIKFRILMFEVLDYVLGRTSNYWRGGELQCLPLEIQPQHFKLIVWRNLQGLNMKTVVKRSTWFSAKIRESAWLRWQVSWPLPAPTCRLQATHKCFKCFLKYVPFAKCRNHEGHIAIPCISTILTCVNTYLKNIHGGEFIIDWSRPATVTKSETQELIPKTEIGRKSNHIQQTENWHTYRK